MDCSKTIDFFAEAKRFCDSRNVCMSDATDKEQCPLLAFCAQKRPVCAEDVKTATEFVQKWSDEHPKKTYAQDFFEKFPDAPRCKSANGGYPSACRKAIYDEKCPGVGCEECWNEPMNYEETKGA